MTNPTREETTAVKCAGLQGCHELEGVMYDLFVHDERCPKSGASAVEQKPQINEPSEADLEHDRRLTVAEAALHADNDAVPTSPDAVPELLPCPFCGAKPKLIETPEEVHYYVMCIECGANGSDLHGRQDAVDAWNTRNSIASSRAVGDEAQQAAEKRAAIVVSQWMATPERHYADLVAAVRDAILAATSQVSTAIEGGAA